MLKDLLSQCKAVDDEAIVQFVILELHVSWTYNLRDLRHIHIAHVGRSGISQITACVSSILEFISSIEAFVQ